MAATFDYLVSNLDVAQLIVSLEQLSYFKSTKQTMRTDPTNIKQWKEKKAVIFRLFAQESTERKRTAEGRVGVRGHM